MSDERIRLLLIDGPSKNRASYISNGVGNILGQWPSYIVTVLKSSIYIGIFFAAIILISFFIVNERLVIKNNIHERGNPRKLENEFCKRVTNRENHIAARSVKDLSVADANGQIQDTSENLFYSLKEPLNKKQACGVESVLRICPDKFIYLMHFNGNNYRILNKYETFLKRRYSNLNVIRADGPSYLKASPFEGQWKGDNSSVLATGLLTVFQFGGMAISPNLIMTSRQLLDYDTPNCMVDREILFCPEQCSPYSFELITTLAKDMNNGGNNTEKVVDLSIVRFCGIKNYARNGCIGVTRINQRMMCTTMADHCQFIRLKNWGDNDRKWQETAEPFCPEIISSFSKD